MHGLTVLLQQQVVLDLRTLGDVITRPLAVQMPGSDEACLAAILPAMGYTDRVVGAVVVVGSVAGCAGYPAGSWVDAQSEEATRVTAVLADPLHQPIEAPLTQGTPTLAQWVALMNGPPLLHAHTTSLPRTTLIERLMPVFVQRDTPLVVMAPQLAGNPLPASLLAELIPDPHPRLETGAAVIACGASAAIGFGAPRKAVADTQWSALCLVASYLHAQVLVDGEQVRLVPAGAPTPPSLVQFPPALRPDRIPVLGRAND